LDEVFVKINGKFCYLWRAVDHEGEVLETVVTTKRDRAAALKFLKRIMKSQHYHPLPSLVKVASTKARLEGEWPASG
jgi:transposase-like protein